jgi:hypothetical protein
VNSFSQANSEIRGKSFRVLEDLLKRSIPLESVCGIEQYQQTAILFLEEVQIKFDICFGSASPPYADILAHRMEPDNGVRYNEYKGKIFFFSLRHSIQNWRELGESSIRNIWGFVPLEENCDCDFSLCGSENGSRPWEWLNRKAEGFEERTAATREDMSSPLIGTRPIGPDSYPLFDFMSCEEAFVSKTGDI